MLTQRTEHNLGRGREERYVTSTIAPGQDSKSPNNNSARLKGPVHFQAAEGCFRNTAWIVKPTYPNLRDNKRHAFGQGSLKFGVAGPDGLHYDKSNPIYRAAYSDLGPQIPISISEEFPRISKIGNMGKCLNHWKCGGVSLWESPMSKLYLYQSLLPCFILPISPESIVRSTVSVHTANT